MAAPVGDDVMGDDPSVNRLQAAVAERAGKEAGLFFPSGTQSNLAALMAHCERGDEYLVGQLAHTYRYEGGGAAVLGSIQPQPIEHAADGTLPLERLAEAVKPKGDPHYARTRLLALENTFQGKLIPATYIEAASAWARGLGLACIWTGRACSMPPSPAAGRWPSCARRSTRFPSVFQGLARPWARCWSAAARDRARAALAQDAGRRLAPIRRVGRLPVRVGAQRRTAGAGS